MTDGMAYEQTKVKKFKGLRVAKAKDMVTKRDERTLDKMPSRTILHYLYKKHQSGIYMVVSAVLFVLVFVQYLIK